MPSEGRGHLEDCSLAHRAQSTGWVVPDLAQGIHTAQDTLRHALGAAVHRAHHLEVLNQLGSQSGPQAWLLGMGPPPGQTAQ